MLDDIRTRLKRNGMLAQIIGGAREALRDLSRTSMSDEAMFTANNVGRETT